jgi:uncharacterized protein (TIGR02271 family)
MESTMQPAVIAVFDSSADAQAAVDDLKSYGVDDQEIYMSSADSGTAGTSTSAGYSERHASSRHEGGFIGWLKSLFRSDDEADRDRYEGERNRYESAMNEGKIVLSVQTTEEDVDEVVDILNRHSPVDVQEGAPTSSAAQAGAYTGSAYTDTPRAASTAQANESQSIPVVAEELKIGKRAVVRGGVRIYSRVVEQPVEESVRLREEQVRVHRQPVNRAATEADLRAGQRETIEVKEYAEEPVVSKESRVVEEVRIGKNATERTETLKDTVRRTEVEVENLEKKGPQSSSGTDDVDKERRAKSASKDR